MYTAPLQVEMLISIDFLQENGVQRNCRTEELGVGAIVAPIFQANSTSVQVKADAKGQPHLQGL